MCFLVSCSNGRGQVSPVWTMAFRRILLSFSSCVQFKIMWLIVLSYFSPQGHVELGIILNPWRHDLVKPWPVTIAVYSAEIGIMVFILSFMYGKNNLLTAPFVQLVHCSCHFVISFSFPSIIIVCLGILLYSNSPMSSVATFLARQSAVSFPCIPRVRASVCMCVRARMCVCMCVSARARAEKLLTFFNKKEKHKVKTPWNWIDPNENYTNGVLMYYSIIYNICTLSRLRRRGLVRGFISIPFPSLARLSAVDWPSWKSERHERFSEASSVETFYVPITLVSTPVWILSSWVQLSESTSARGRSEELLH